MNTLTLAEWLAKLGPAGTWGPPTSRGTAPERWAPTDLAAALGMVQPAWLGNILLWVYAEQGVAARLAAEFELEMTGADNLRQEDRLQLLVIALWEMRSRFYCPECEGRGEITAGGTTRTCQDCGGSGASAQFSKRMRARMMGVSPATWNQRWEMRYMKVFSWLKTTVADGLHQLRRNLR